MFGHLFDNSIKIVNWLLERNLTTFKGPGKIKSIQLSSIGLKYIPRADQNFGYLPATVCTLTAKYSFEDYLPNRHTVLKQRLFNIKSSAFGVKFSRKHFEMFSFYFPQKNRLWCFMQVVYLEDKFKNVLAS